MSRFLVVSTDLTDKVIKDGPFLANVATDITVGAGQQAILEATALASGYTSPPASAAAVNEQALVAKAQQAIAANITYLGIATPTNAQVVAQVNRLTREATALIRLLLNQLDTTDGS